MNAILSGKKLSGGKLRRQRQQHRKKGKGLVRMRRTGGKVYRKRHIRKARKGRGGRIKKTYKYKGKGVVADTLGSIPLLGALLGPLAKAFGGKLKKMPRKHRRAAIMAIMRKLAGKGLSPMYLRRPYVSSGCGLSPMYLRRPYTGGRLAPIGAPASSSTYMTPTLALNALNNMFPGMRTLPYHPSVPGPKPAQIASYPTGVGLLRPAGGAVYRRGHLRKIKGKAHRIRVKPAMGRGLLSPAGGYIPYKGHYGVYRR